VIADIARKGNWDFSGIACFRLLDGERCILLSQKAESAGYNDIFAVDLSERAEHLPDSFLLNYRKRVREMDTRRLRLLSAWSFEDFARFTQAYRAVDYGTGIGQGLWQRELAAGLRPTFAAIEDAVRGDGRVFQSDDLFHFDTLLENKRIDDSLWDKFVMEAWTELSRRARENYEDDESDTAYLRWGLPKCRNKLGGLPLATAQLGFTEETELALDRVTILSEDQAVVVDITSGKQNCTQRSGIFYLAGLMGKAESPGVDIDYVPENTEIARCKWWSMAELKKSEPDLEKSLKKHRSSMNESTFRQFTEFESIRACVVAFKLQLDAFKAQAPEYLLQRRALLDAHCPILSPLRELVRGYERPSINSTDITDEELFEIFLEAAF
jgi:hypothetical protein